MSQEINNNPNQNNEEVDLIRLLNYFKNGIKSIFRKLWKLVEFVIQFIILLKKYWILVVSLVVLGAVFGKFIRPMLNGGVATKSYEMVVKTNPVSNYELYAMSAEINNQGKENSNPNEEGIVLANSLGIQNMDVEALPKLEDVVKKYYEQTETNTVRGYDTDTLFYQGFEMKNYKSNMEDTDYSFQKIQMKVNSNVLPKDIQKKFLEYINTLPGIKREQEAKLAALTVFENEIKNSLAYIDTLMVARAVASRNAPAGAEQTLVNTASRGNVEADLLRYSEMFSKRLYGAQRMKSDVEQGVQVISNLRAVGNTDILSPLLKYALYGFLLASVIILGIQFNKYLDRYSEQKLN